MADLLASPNSNDAVAVIIGFPSDEGVRQNGGRPGAAAAPAAIREAFGLLTPGPAAGLRAVLSRTVDLGDVEVSGDVDADQQRLAGALEPWLARGATPILLGGGHETSFGHFLAYAALSQSVSILNWDAHPDVRPLKDGLGHSGSPFRQALEHASGRCRRYVVAGLQPQRVAAAHLSFIREHDGDYHWRDAVTTDIAPRLHANLPGPTLVSFDMDAVDAAFAPGVSAPAANGLAPAEWLAAARAAGRHPDTRSIDLVEVNPRFDADGRTARLAALTIWTFLLGLSERT